VTAVPLVGTCTAPAPLTTTTLPPCPELCAPGTATNGPACLGQTLPAKLVRRLDAAVGLAARAVTAPAARAGRLRSKAGTLLSRARTAAAHAALGKHPRLTPTCAQAIQDAVDRIAAGLAG
jgi:hypothetical protein